MTRSLSVIIPSYNHARFIAKAIESVAAQEEKGLELIVVDDGSTDESAEVIESLLAEIEIPKVQFIRQKNQGAPAAIARGISASGGELVTILNSDDAFSPRRFSRMREEIPEHGDFFAFSMVRMVGDDDLPLPDTNEAVTGYRHALYESTRCPTVGYALLKINFAVTSGNFVLTRNLYEKLGGFRDYSLAHDWDFALRALYHVEPIFVAEPLLDYRTHAENTRHSLQDRSLSEGRKILNDYVALCTNERPPNRIAPCKENWPVYFDLFSAYHEPWFDRAPIRHHLDHPPPARPKSDVKGWRPWSWAVDFHSVEGRGYFTDAENPPADLEALAIARSVAIDSPDDVVSKYGSFADSLRDVLQRQIGDAPVAETQHWISPFFAHHDQHHGIQPGIQSRSRLSQIRNFLGDAKSLISSAFSDPFSISRASALLKEWRYAREIKRSGVFEFAFYREQASHVVLQNEMAAIRHYLRDGARQGLDPNPFFGTSYYLDANPDVSAAGYNPLCHFLTHGDKELRWPHPQFDPTFYRNRFNPPVGTDQNALAHYLAIGRKKNIRINAADAIRVKYEGKLAPTKETNPYPPLPDTGPAIVRLRRSAFFDAMHYRTLALPGFLTIGDSARHFVEHGALSGFSFVPESRLQELIWDLDITDREHPEFKYLNGARDQSAQGTGARVAIYLSSCGNSFHREIADVLAFGFVQAGAEAFIRDEKTEPDDRATHSIIIAPHEFFHLGEGRARCTREFLSRSHLFLAEQPGSKFFSICLWYAYRARGVLDINPLTARVWTQLGIDAKALPLGYIEEYAPYGEGTGLSSSPTWQSLGPEVRNWRGGTSAPLSERPIDLFFNGVLTGRREWFFACNAQRLAKHRSAFFMPTAAVPIKEDSPSALGEGIATAISQRSKIQLNIHRSDMPYFEWHRNIVRSMWQKTLLVTETSYRIPGFEPGEHYIECDLNRMVDTTDWLLSTTDGRETAERVRERAFKTLKEMYPLQRILSAFLDDTQSRKDR